MCKGWDPGPASTECTDRNSRLAAPNLCGWLPASQPHVVGNAPTSVGESRWTLGVTVVHRLPAGAVLLDEGSGNGRPDDLAGGDSHSLELKKACNQSGKPQGPIGPLRVHRVSHRLHPCKLINDIRNQLSHVHTHLRQNGINQLTLWQGEVRVVVVGQNVAD